MSTLLLGFQKMCTSLCVKTNAYAALVSPAKHAYYPEDFLAAGDENENLSPDKDKDLNAEVMFYYETPIKTMGMSAGLGSSGESSLLDQRGRSHSHTIKSTNWFSFHHEH